MNTTTEPRIYIACLSAYNAGFLNGKWIDASSDVDEMWQHINEVLKDSHKVLIKHDAIFKHDVCEEWAIHDHEGFHIEIGEYTGIDTIADYMEALEQCQDDEQFEALIKFHDHMGYKHDLDTTQGYFEDHSQGIWNSFRDYSDNYVDDCIIGCLQDAPEVLQQYFDYESYARDLEHEMITIELSTGNVAVFNN